MKGEKTKLLSMQYLIVIHSTELWSMCYYFASRQWFQSGRRLASHSTSSTALPFAVFELIAYVGIDLLKQTKLSEHLSSVATVKTVRGKEVMWSVRNNSYWFLWQLFKIRLSRLISTFLLWQACMQTVPFLRLYILYLLSHLTNILDFHYPLDNGCHSWPIFVRCGNGVVSCVSGHCFASDGWIHGTLIGPALHSPLNFWYFISPAFHGFIQSVQLL